jgi:hypothetical protein
MQWLKQFALDLSLCLAIGVGLALALIKWWL